jgi:hypothetical protein
MRNFPDVHVDRLHLFQKRERQNLGIIVENEWIMIEEECLPIFSLARSLSRSKKGENKERKTSLGLGSLTDRSAFAGYGVFFPLMG